MWSQTFNENPLSEHAFGMNDFCEAIKLQQMVDWEQTVITHW